MSSSRPGPRPAQPGVPPRRLVTGVLLAGALALTTSPAQAAIGLDLSYVDTNGTAYSRFHSWVDITLGGNPQYGFSATDAVYLYRISGNATYAQLAIDWVEDQVTEAEAEIALGHRAPVSNDSYLEVGPMIRDVALVYDWCYPLLTVSQRQRWAAYAEQAVWNVWHHDQASWGGNSFPWSGWSVDNPGNNYHFSFLTATMYWALASNNPTWLSFLSTQKLPPLVTYWQGVPGGGSREGTGYGVALWHLFELYRLWKDSTGQDLGAASTHLLDTLDYWLHATVPTGDRYAPIGDLARESYPNLYDYHRALVLAARAAAAPAAPARARASWWLHQISVDEMQSGFNLRDDLLPAGTGAPVALPLLHQATGTGHLFARTAWTPTALWMSFVAGPYVESHAHQDQGSFNLFRNDFLAVTENVFTHSGIAQGTEIPNVLRFDAAGVPIPQRDGHTSTMTVTPAGSQLRVAADLSPVYVGSAVHLWHRDLVFDVTGLDVHDTYAVDPGVVAVFQVNTPVQPMVVGGAIVAGGLRIVPVIPANPTITILDWHTVDADEYNEGWKVELRGGTGEYLVRLEAGNGIFVDGFESGNRGAWSAGTP